MAGGEVYIAHLLPTSRYVQKCAEEGLADCPPHTGWTVCLRRNDSEKLSEMTVECTVVADSLPHMVTFVGGESAIQKLLLNPKTPLCVDGPANRPLSKKLDGRLSASQGRTVRPLKND